MPHIIEVTDLAAPELDVYARLTEARLRNRLEPDKGVFIAESPKVIATALDAGYEPLSLLMERRHIEGDAQPILARCGGIPVYTAERETLARLTGFELTRGVLCAMRRPRLPSVEEVCARARRVAVLEGIVDHTNVGAIFRSAAALGIDAVLVTPTCCDPFYRRAVRVSMGTVFQVPWARIGEDAADWPQKGVERLHALGFRTAAMAAGDRARHGGRRPFAAHHCRVRLHGEDPHGARRGFAQRGGGKRRGVLAASDKMRIEAYKKTLRPKIGRSVFIGGSSAQSLTLRRPSCSARSG